MVVIRLQRAGARNRPFFRLVVADSRRSRDGAFIEKVGYYDPLPTPDVIVIDHARVEHWIKNGAQPSVSVQQLVRRSKLRALGIASAEPKRRKRGEQAAQPAPSAEPAAAAAAEAGPTPAAE
ncbi:MAG: 30S ribosomal protein S16 [Candidatus Eisenbacteria bacterium]|nr:30S ribosomal protein S16 [Candidatus Eisenbacteria bacterium]